MRLSRDSLAALIATAAFLVVVILGFYKTRGPSTQRLLRADGKRVQNIHQLAEEINMQFRQTSKSLPVELSELQKTRYKDPTSGKPLEYSTKSSTKYAICTTFVRPGPEDDANGTFAFWKHPAGHKCFEFEASEQVPSAPYNYYY